MSRDQTSQICNDSESEEYMRLVAEIDFEYEAEQFFEVECAVWNRQAPRQDRKSTRLNSSHIPLSRMPSSA